MIHVLNVPLYDKDIATAVAEVLQGIESGTSKDKNLCISATGAHGLVEASKDLNFKQTLTQFHINLPDGMPAVWIGRLKGAKQMRRCYGPAFFEAMMRASAKQPIHHFFCGGKEGVAEALRAECGRVFENKQIVGVYCPPFRNMTDKEMRELGQQIINSGAHMVWIGLSTPKQEIFAERLARFTRTCNIITVGAAFDFHTGKVKQAPKWMQQMGLEWFFRLLMEPKRLFKRYFEIVPKFIWLNIKEFLHFYIYKKKYI